MNDADPSPAAAPTPPPLPATAAVAPHGQARPLGYAMPGLPAPDASAPYASARPRAKVVVALSWAMIAVQLVLLWPAAEAVRYWSMDDPGAWEPLGGRSFRVLAAFARTVPGVVFSVLYAVAVVYWCMWVHRTYRNLPALGAAGLRWTPGWAVGYYFIPILNLFRPYQVMSETWRASDPRHEGAADWKSLAAPPLLGGWWAMHLVTFFVSQSTVKLAMWPQGAESMLVATLVNGGMLVFDMVLLLVEIRIVRELTDRQERRAEAVGLPAAVGRTTPAGW